MSAADQHRVYLSDVDFERLSEIADAVRELGHSRPSRTEVAGAIAMWFEREISAGGVEGGWTKEVADQLAAWRRERITRGLPCR